MDLDNMDLNDSAVFKEVWDNLDWDETRDSQYENDRKYIGWGTVERIDKEDEALGVADINKNMDKYFAIGAPTSNMHNNQKTGEMLKWKYMERNGKPGILVGGFVHRTFDWQNKIWNAMQTGDYDGLSMAGGFEDREVGFKDAEGRVGTKLVGVKPHEIALCEKDSEANPDASIIGVNHMAKSLMFAKTFIKTLSAKNTQTKSKGGNDMAKDVKKQVEVPVVPEEEAPVEITPADIMAELKSQGARIAALESKTEGTMEETEKEDEEEETEEEEKTEEKKTEKEETEEEEKTKGTAKKDMEDSTEEASEPDESPNFEAETKPEKPPEEGVSITDEESEAMKVRKQISKEVEKQVEKALKKVTKKTTTPVPAMSGGQVAKATKIQTQINEVQKALKNKQPIDFTAIRKAEQAEGLQNEFDALKNAGLVM